MAWDDEKRAKAVELYTAANPTPENTVEVLAEVAEKLGESVNGVRMVLSRAEVYVKKETTATKPKKEGSGAPRVSKEAAQAALTELLEAEGLEVDNDIISKLTGKAAVYFTELFKKVT